MAGSSTLDQPVEDFKGIFSSLGQGKPGEALADSFKITTGISETQGLINDVTKSATTPTLENPDAKSTMPSLQQASTSALQNQLAQEANARLTSTYLTSGQGLLDQPTTTSRILLGS